MINKNDFINNFSFPGWTVPAFLALLCFFSFGILIPGLGFYWDDWAKILVYRLQGPAYYWPYYVGDRPLSAWTHLVLTPILGVKPFAWQIFTLAMRFLSALGLYYLLVLLRPNFRLPAAMAAGIFAVYPLFGQQPIAVTFHQQWMQFALIIASFDCMVLSIRSTRFKIFWVIFSLFLSVLQLSITEYFAPLELLRPFILWFAFPNDSKWKRKVIQVVKAWIPYLTLIVAFFIWRVFLMPLPGDDPYKTEVLFDFFIKPGQTIIWLGKTVIIDLVHIFFGSWTTVFQTRLTQPLSLTFLAALIGSIAIGGFSVFYLMKIRNSGNDETRENSWIRMALTIGLAGALIGPIPAWITQRQVLFDFHSDRYALPAILGLSILTAGLIEWLGRSRLQKAALVGLIIMLGSGYQIRTVVDFQANWSQQMRLYWQLYWRAPRLEAPTAIYSENELVPNQGLFSMSGALNQLYPQDDNPDLMDFWFYTLLPKYNAGPPKSMSISNDSTFRTLRYIGSSPNTLLVHNDPAHGNCLWVLRAEDQWNPYLPELPKAMLPISNIERIKADAVAGYPPEELFGKEPSHDWCYAYEKAELAWQNQNWSEIVRIGEEQKSAGLSPIKGISNSPREWWPFIVGYARNDQVREAIEISQQSLRQDKRYHEAICVLWSSMQDVPDVGVGLSELGCPQ
jgi:hypothetical protein